MAETLRSCKKTGCRWPAAASLSYRYATRQVWLLDLSATPDPSLYDLCPHHADALVIPKGWTRVDSRVERPAMVEPSADDRAAAARRVEATQPAPPEREREPVGAMARPARPSVLAARTVNRYARLMTELPRLASELSHDDDPTPTPPPPSAPAAAAADPEPTPPPVDGTAAVAMTVAASPPGAVPLHGSETLAPAWSQDPPGEVAGQLIMPGLDDDADRGGVVIELSGSRRRGRGVKG